MSASLLSAHERRWLNENAERLISLGNDAFQLLLSRLVEISQIATSGGARIMVGNLSRESGAPIDDIQGAVACIVTISNLVLTHGVENALNELTGLNLAASNQEQFTVRAAAIAERVTQVNEELTNRLARAKARKGVLPYFEDIGITVELRGVLASQDAEHVSSPEVPYVGLEPIASVCINVDSGDPGVFPFQIGRDDLRRLRVALETAEKRLDEIVAFTTKGTSNE